MHFESYHHLDSIMGTRTNTNTVTLRKQQKDFVRAAPPTESGRNLRKGVWQLARLHTKEAWLCWYPAVWGLCLSAGTQDIRLDISQMAKILFGIWSSVTVTHCAFCTWDDICDVEFDKQVERCKVRPLPAGMLTVEEAYVALLAWLPVVFGVTYLTLGEAGMWTFAPVWVLSTIYPFMKRVTSFPQIVLGAIIGAAVFPGWASATGDLATLSQGLPLFFATASWVVYFDLFYAEQDRPDDIKAGVKSLAVLLGDHVHFFLAFLGVLQVGFFTLTGLRAQMSPVFWVLGLGVWAVNVIWHVVSLDLNNRKSGGKIFKANIMLGLYMTVISVLELAVSRLSMSDLRHMGQSLIGMHVS
ncbi:hypothetical protein PMIN03_008111 [Paraphaeosphaeria minitans]